ncbi:hypothetical protein CN491_04270 [Bacillus cereus]|uniref:Uncharacterized protein n=1 Tax=Bacillus cereus TaxID=1396 RepID=A0A2A8LTK3_BACCE|nr:hypothetical protein [Bacillus cereus]PES98038.1 hypothetical protein CN491_04270 [Bacillus cereus]PFP75475.1 hypothetical protein COJ95_17690 [Bacillus cereus]
MGRKKIRISTRKRIQGKECRGILCSKKRDSWKPLSEFRYDNHNQRYRSHCNDCNQVRKQLYEEKNVFKYLAFDIRKSPKGCDNINWEQKLKELWDVQEGRCAISGVEMVFNRGSFLRVSPDRINNDLGYVEDNVRLVCWFLNKLRSNTPLEEFDPQIKGFVKAIESAYLLNLAKSVGEQEFKAFFEQKLIENRDK